jgi:diaminobutyrate-2-oxoglutarate transaminase
MTRYESGSAAVEALRLEASFKQRRALRNVPYAIDDSPLLMRQRSRESNARSYPRRLPIALRRGHGVYVEDTDGRVYMDFLAAAGTLVLGHNHPQVVSAISRALETGLPMQTLDLMTPAKDEFVTQLLSMLPSQLAARARVQFCGPTGTDAIEAALKLVRTATGRKNMLAFRGGYHGMSQGSLALMGNLGPKKALDGTLEHVQFLPYPYRYRCPFGLGDDASEAVGIAYIESLLQDPESGVLPPAGMILEAVQGEGGVIAAPATWLQELRRVTSAAGVPLILDEVQTGFGRTGRMFAFEHADITPDVVVLSKALGGGLPLSLVVYDESLDRWQPGAHAGTFRGNQLAMVSGLETLRVIKEQRLERRAELLGAKFRAELCALQREFACIGEVRGLGLMVGMELVDPDGKPDRLGHPPAATEIAQRMQAACLRRGLILEVGGRFGATLRFLPPLIVTETELEVAVDILRDALASTLRERGAERARSIQ